MCIACESNLNAEALDAFGERYVELLNAGALMMMMSIGYRTGLFEAMRNGDPFTSGELADRAGLNERYVREWLGVMTTGRIVECDPDGSRFLLPSAHAALLTDLKGADNLGHLTQYISMIGSVEEPLIECFRNGGGVPYSAFPRFHEVMAIDSRQTIVDPLFEHILPLVPGLSLQLHNGIDVLDVGCGRGMALLKMARHYPASRFCGYDLSEEAVAFATAEARRLGLENIQFESRDLTHFNESAPAAAFDLVTAFDAIHDQARPDQVLAGIRRALKEQGIFFMQDIAADSNVAANLDHPIGPLMYAISCAHCMTVSLAQGGMGLGAMWGEQQARLLLQQAGFSSVQKHTLAHDFQNDYYVVRP